MIALLALIMSQGGDTLEDRRDTAVRAAAARVAPSLVTIETSGGTEIVGGQPGAGEGPAPRGFAAGWGPLPALLSGPMVGSSRVPSILPTSPPAYSWRWVAKGMWPGLWLPIARAC